MNLLLLEQQLGEPVLEYIFNYNTYIRTPTRVVKVLQTRDGGVAFVHITLEEYENEHTIQRATS
jgi:hypothetical protein